jgi:hypothetical protein
MKPAPWPAWYQPIAWPMNVAASAPPMPSAAVRKNPDGPAPGVSHLAISPATNPMMIVQIRCMKNPLDLYGCCGQLPMQ